MIGPRTKKISRALRDPAGHLLMDQEENLSDKEVFARNVPAIEITRESASDFDQFSEEDRFGFRKPARTSRRKNTRQAIMNRTF